MASTWARISGSEVQMLCIKMGKNYGQQTWAARTPKNYFLVVETVEPYKSDAH